MVLWAEQGSVKLVKLWTNNFVCLWHLTGFIFTIILLEQFSSDNSTCTDSFFAYYRNGTTHNATYRNGTIYNVTGSCYFTTRGQLLFIWYFIFSGIGLFLFLLTFFYLIIVPWVDRDDDICTHRHLYVVPCIIPTYLIALACVGFSTFYPKIFLKSDLVITFNRKWMGYTSREWTSWLIMVAQTVYLLENGLEVTIGIGVLLSKYNSYLIFYLIFSGLSTLARFMVFGIRFLKTSYEYIKDDFFGVCCQTIDKASHDEI